MPVVDQPFAPATILADRFRSSMIHRDERLAVMNKPFNIPMTTMRFGS